MLYTPCLFAVVVTTNFTFRAVSRCGLNTRSKILSIAPYSTIFFFLFRGKYWFESVLLFLIIVAVLMLEYFSEILRAQEICKDRATQQQKAYICVNGLCRMSENKSPIRVVTWTVTYQVLSTIFNYLSS
jgi:hypothetical protein